jgi:hypothetical protein
MTAKQLSLLDDIAGNESWPYPTLSYGPAVGAKLVRDGLARVKRFRDRQGQWLVITPAGRAQLKILLAQGSFQLWAAVRRFQTRGEAR